MQSSGLDARSSFSNSLAEYDRGRTGGSDAPVVTTGRRDRFILCYNESLVIDLWPPHQVHSRPPGGPGFLKVLLYKELYN